MLIRLGINTYIRVFSDYSYLENQVTHQKMVFYNDEHYIIKQIGRFSRLLENISIPRNDRQWLKTYLNYLSEFGMVVIGENEDELSKKDLLFSYSGKKTIEDKINNLQNNYLSENSGLWLKRIELEITPHCNERCLHCYIPINDKIKRNEISLSMAKDIIDQFCNMGGLSIILSGGEPFLNKDIMKIVSYCREKDLMITILSNLTNVTNKQIEGLKDVRPFLIQTSLYSMDGKIHDKITQQRGSYDKTLKNIEKCIENDIPLMISCPMTSINMESYVDVLNFSKRIGADFTSDYILLAQYDKNCANLKVRMSPDQIRQHLYQVVTNSSFYINLIKSSKSEKDLLSQKYAIRKTCNVLQHDLCISSKGNVFACPSWQDYPLGDITHSSLFDIWTNSARAKTLRGVRRKDFQQCKECGLKNFCEMCMVYNYNENGGDYMNVSKRFCITAQIFKEVIIDTYYKCLKDKNNHS